MPTLRNILGVSAYYHTAAALVIDGKIIFAAQEERFTQKNDSEFPARAIQFCLNHASLTPAQLDAVAYYGFFWHRKN